MESLLKCHIRVCVCVCVCVCMCVHIHTYTDHGVLKVRSGLPFPSPVDHILSELSTTIRPSWVALQGMAHSFIDLDKAVVHVIKLVSFL